MKSRETDKINGSLELRDLGEAGVRMGGGGGRMVMTANGYRVSFWDDENTV